MGQKANPRGLRLIVDRNWGSVWHDDNNYAELLKEDREIREYLEKEVGSAGIDELVISRSTNDIEIDLTVARPGLVIGRGGSMIEKIQKTLSTMVQGKIRLNVQEVSNPNLSAVLVAESVVSAIERNYPYKRAIRSSAQRVMDAGAKGLKIFVSGRLGGNRIARTEKFDEGSVPTSTLSENIRYAFREAKTKYGTVGVKVWITQPEEE